MSGENDITLRIEEFINEFQEKTSKLLQDRIKEGKPPDVEFMLSVKESYEKNRRDLAREIYKFVYDKFKFMVDVMCAENDELVKKIDEMEKEREPEQKQGQ